MEGWNKVVDLVKSNKPNAPPPPPDEAPTYGRFRTTVSYVALAVAILSRILPRIMTCLFLLIILVILIFVAYCRLYDEGFWRQIRVISWVARPLFEWNLLHWWMFNLPHKYRDAFLAEFHKKWAEYPLAICLSMRGFYVKLGQQASFGVEELVPAPYRKSLAILQENVPAEPFATTRRTVEGELGCPMEDIFRNFDETPVASASIGQVHFAELLDGTPVVAKVQYPDVQRYFRVDMRTILRIMRFTSPQFKQMLQEQENNFAKEFDYVKEGRNLRIMYDRLNGFSDIQIPEPYDSKHRNCPTRFVKTGGLVTNMLLVMDRVPGRSITKIATGFLEQFARTQGLTVKEFKEDIMDKMKDPEFINEIMDMGQSAAMELAATQVFLSTRSLAWNAFAATYNWSVGLFATNLDYEWTGVAFNGASLIRRLYDIHGEQIFAVGMFNADPHVGNLMLDEKSGGVYLLDFGQLYEIKKSQRLLFAKTIVALLDGDKPTVHKCWKKMGNEFWWIGPGEMDEVELYYAMVHSIYNGNTGLEYLMELTGCPNFMTYMERVGYLIHIQRISAVAAMIHRMTDCLRGAAMTLGAGNPSAAAFYRPSAERFLKSQKGFPG